MSCTTYYLTFDNQTQWTAMADACGANTVQDGARDVRVYPAGWHVDEIGQNYFVADTGQTDEAGNPIMVHEPRDGWLVNLALYDALPEALVPFSNGVPNQPKRVFA